MSNQKARHDAVDILRRRYVGEDPVRVTAVERERTNAEVAQLIYERRTAAGLSQKELAKLVGTTQSVISRLEDADYEGHSLTMLQRIARALGQRVTIGMAPLDGRRTA
jgi:ribosome-binding protein aMBF1 (putative translation factor)